MPRPIVAIVGRPNVGKSALFNRLIERRMSVVEETPGVTRDRLYAPMPLYGRTCALVDTGGLDPEDKADLTQSVARQVQVAMDEADAILFLVDAQAGPVELDYRVADLVRKTDKPLIFAANKCDQPSMRNDDFFALRLGEPLYVSAMHGHGSGDLVDAIDKLLPPWEEEPDTEDRTTIAIVGRPNVGKSSLLNALLGEERAIVGELPGTTRDTIDTDLEWEGHRFRLIDTAGIRRKTKVTESLEYYCVLRAMRALDRASVVAVVIDAKEGVTAQDARIAGLAADAGKGIVLVVNKWDQITDSLDPEIKTMRTVAKGETSLHADFEREVRITLPFLSYAEIVYTCALTSRAVQLLLRAAAKADENNARRCTTGQVNRVLSEALVANPPSSRKGRNLKVLYGTQPSARPPAFILFVNDPELLHFSYRRYLENQLRKKFELEGTPIRVIVRKRASGRDEETIH
jgi:GTP-binding protein